MDLHASRLVRPVTEYSATQGSSGFSCGYWPGMDTARLLLTLEQGLRSLKDYIQEYLDLAYFSDLPDCVLIDFFCEGINQPLKSRLIREGPRSSLSQFMDYALLTVGSAFTVSVAEERDTARTRVMAAAPEHAHKMAATAELNRKMADATSSRSVTAANSELSQVTVDLHELSQATVDLHESSQVTVDHHESSQVTVDRHESNQVTVDRHESSQVTVDRHESSQVTVDRHESSQATVDRHESSQVKVDLPESLHISADLPESLHVFADLPESLHVSADLPESHHVSADLPESHHVTAHHPESHHVTADHPESCNVLSLTPRYSRSVLRFPSLVSSVRDVPLVSARAAGIPKSTHSNPYVPELISLSEAIPMMGIALCCVWAACNTTELLEVAKSTVMSPEVAAHAAEPPEAAVLASAPCMVVAPSNSYPARHVTVEGTVDEHCPYPVNELYLFPDVTTVEPPEVAASAAEPSEVSVVNTFESSSCPVTAMEAVCELLPCFELATEANNEPSFAHVTATEAVFEHLYRSEPAMVADCELSVYLISANVSDFELSVLPVSGKKSTPELSAMNSETVNVFLSSSNQ